MARWSSVDADRLPEGNPRFLKHRLVPSSDRAGWTVRVALPRDEDSYLAVTGEWHDEEGCGSIQDATWIFSVTAK